MENILRDSRKNLNANIGVFFTLVFMQNIISSIIQRSFFARNLFQLLVILPMYLASSFVSAIVLDYMSLETYLAFKEERNVRFFGFVKVFLEGGKELFLLSLFKNLKIFLWSILFILPGIYKALEYNRVLISKLENPDLYITECFEKSKDEMDGRKLELFKYYFKIFLPTIIIIIAIIVFSLPYILYILKINPNFDFVPISIPITFILFIILVVVYFIAKMYKLSLFGTFNSKLSEILNEKNKNRSLFSEYNDESEENYETYE